MLSQQPIDTALRQLIAHQQHRVIESALPVFTSQRHTPILQAHSRQTRSGTPKPGHKISAVLGRHYPAKFSGSRSVPADNGKMTTCSPRKGILRRSTKTITS